MSPFRVEVPVRHLTLEVHGGSVNGAIFLPKIT